MTNSIFGITAPKFKAADNITVVLDNIIIESENDNFNYQDIIHESIHNRYRVWTDMEEHFTFKLLMNLFKYENPEEAYALLKKYHRTLVELWRRGTGNSFRNSNDEIVLFRFDKLTEAYVNTINFPDVLLLEFVSQDPIDFSKSRVNYVP